MITLRLSQAEGEDFEALPWYSAVEKFCHGQGYEESENADEKTLPAIIEKAILPKIRGKLKFWFHYTTLYVNYFTITLRRILHFSYSRLYYNYSYFYSQIQNSWHPWFKKLLWKIYIKNMRELTFADVNSKSKKKTFTF